MLKRGALMMVIAMWLFALVGAFVKMASIEMPNEMVVFFRNFFGLLALMPLVIRSGFSSLRTHRFGEHVYRSVSGLAAMYCSFYSIEKLPLADALLLNYTSPLFMPIIAKISLKEPIPRGIWGCLLLGFAGVVVVLKPGATLFQPVALIAVLAGFLAALAQVGIRKLTPTEPTVRIVFYFALISSVASGLPVLPSWHMPTVSGWGLALAIGGVATVAQLFLTKSYHLAPPAQVGPFVYTTVVFAGFLDWLLWGRLPDVFFLIGATLVGTAGVLVIKRMSDVASAQEISVKQ